MRKFNLAIFIFLILINSSYAETLQMTTYYPAPFGAYDRLRLVPRDNLTSPCEIGMLFVNSSGELQYCRDESGTGTWGPTPGVFKQTNAEIYFSDSAQIDSLKLGLGLNNPTARLTIQGMGNDDTTMSVLVTDSGSNPALVIQDDLMVGIRKLDPDNPLEVNGAIEIEVDNADSKLRFNDPGNNWYSMGIDQSDGGKFKINFGSNIGDVDQFSMTPSGDVIIGGTLQVKNNGANTGVIKVQYVGGMNAGYYPTYAP